MTDKPVLEQEADNVQEAQKTKIKEVAGAKEWNVIYTTPRAEKRVYARLIEEGIDAYLPLYTTIRQWSDRKKKVKLPLFNSYIFVKVNAKERWQVLQVYGVVRFVYYLQKPAVVRQKEIDAIKRFLTKTQGFRISVEKGDQVEIASGPFEGIYGKVIRVGKDKLILQIEQLSMSLTAEVDKGQVKKPLKKMD